MKRKFIAAVSVVLCFAMTSAVFTGCAKKQKISNEDTPLILMSEELDDVFNPFFATTGPDMEIVGQTQLSMLSTDRKGDLAYGENEPTVVLDYGKQYDSVEDKTTYTFVLKNDLVFSDGVPLTIRDVLFNMYVYLDPVYTGSSTMYSTDIVGMQDYRTQTYGSDSSYDPNQEKAQQDAAARLKNLANAIADIKDEFKNEHLSVAQWKTNLGKAYNPEPDHSFVDDYEWIGERLAKELDTDYRGGIGSYDEIEFIGPKGETNYTGLIGGEEKTYYKLNEVEGFYYTEGFFELDRDGKQIKDWGYNHEGIKTRDAAIADVYDTMMTDKLGEVIYYTATAGDLMTKYTAEALSAILHEKGNGESLNVPNISGIKSLGDEGETTVEVVRDATESTERYAKTYRVSSTTNADHSVKNKDEYQVLSVTINGVDPKAIWNFGFTVAPMHYYSTKALNDAFNYQQNKFGVVYSELSFMEDVLKGGDKVGVPLGAGPYVATNYKYSESLPKSGEFKSNNVVYFRRNDHFLLGAPKIRKLDYQVVNSNQAINSLVSGQVHYATPQATVENVNKLERASNLETKTVDQLGYGYVGINAGYVKNINLRKAIMSSMNPELAVKHYGPLAEPLTWSMSKVSWAYPTDATGAAIENTAYKYLGSDNLVKEEIWSKMDEAGCTGNYRNGELARYKGEPLKFNFTIAGSSLAQHPTYAVFKKSAELLNACGWQISVVPDNQALTKLSSGSLAVWAAAWGSTIDPDMYQVYHKDSKATSVRAWGYRQIQDDKTTYSAEWKIMQDLSERIMDARHTDDQALRKSYYKDCLQYVSDLAVELPIYQRKNIFAYNSSVIDSASLQEANAYVAPLSRIWEVSLNETK